MLVRVSCAGPPDDDDGGTFVVELIEPPDPDDFQLFSIDLRILGLAGGCAGGATGAEVEGIMRNGGADMCGLGRSEESFGGGGGGGGVEAGYDGGAAGVSGRGGNDGARWTGYGDS